MSSKPHFTNNFIMVWKRRYFFPFDTLFDETLLGFGQLETGLNGPFGITDFRSLVWILSNFIANYRLSSCGKSLYYTDEYSIRFFFLIYCIHWWHINVISLSFVFESQNTHIRTGKQVINHTAHWTQKPNFDKLSLSEQRFKLGFFLTVKIE